MKGNELIASLGRALEEAHLARPDIPLDDLIAGPNAAPQSIQEFNASGEVMVFVCCRVEVSDFANDHIVAGSIMRKCEACFCDVWMSPATFNLWARLKNKRIHCPECSVKAVKNERA